MKVKSIELVLENCETYKIDSDLIKWISIDNVCQQVVGGHLGYTCSGVRIVLSEEATRLTNQQQFSTSTLEERLLSCPDITHISLIFDDDSEMYIQVPWTGNEEINTAQSYNSEAGEIKIYDRS